MSKTKENSSEKARAGSQTVDAAPAGTGTNSTFSPERRRLIRVGLVAAPVLMTVANRPVLAKGGNMCSLSGKLSGNLSHQHEETVCVGLTPGYWGQHPNEWGPLMSLGIDYEPGGCARGRRTGKHCKFNEYEDITVPGGSGVPSPTPFHVSDVNADGVSGPFIGSLYSGLSMMQVIQLAGTDDRYQLGAHAVAALLNATKWPPGGYYTYGLSPQQVVDLWSDMITFGTPAPEELKYQYQMLNEVGG